MQSQVNGANASDTDTTAPTPIAPWVNIALRALDTSVATSQNLIEGVDRLARAGAGSDVPAQPQALTPALWSGPKAALACSMALAMAVQRSAISLFTEGWRQWIRAIGDMTAVAALRRSAEFSPGEQRARTWDEPQPAGATPGRGSVRHGDGARSHEHAAASTGTKRRVTRRRTARRAK